MDVFAETAGLGAVNAALVRQEGASQQRVLTVGTAEAALRSMPVEPIIGHLSMIHTWKKNEDNWQLSFKCYINIVDV